jgi:hypothetical protein
MLKLWLRSVLEFNALTVDMLRPYQPYAAVRLEQRIRVDVSCIWTSAASERFTPSGARHHAVCMLARNVTRSMHLVCDAPCVAVARWMPVRDLTCMDSLALLHGCWHSIRLNVIATGATAETIFFLRAPAGQ